MCLAVALTLIQTGCGEPQPKFRIGVSQCSDDAWRSQMNDEIRREMLFHDDAEVEIRSSDDDNDRQIKDIDYFIDNGFDIIIVSPREANAITPVIKKAYDKGIPVIVFDRSINGDSYTSYIKLDNYGIGRAAAEYAVHALGDGPAKIIEIRGLDDSSPAKERHRGFNNVIDSTRDKTVVASVTAGWNETPAYMLTDSLLKLHPDVKLVYAHNDVMALGASKALKKHDRDDVIVLGTDAAPALGITAVADSMIDATFIYPTEGERVIRKAMAILKGENYDRIEDVPAQYAVDRSNADILLKQNKLIADKTHQIEMLKDSQPDTVASPRPEQFPVLCSDNLNTPDNCSNIIDTLPQARPALRAASHREKPAAQRGARPAERTLRTASGGHSLETGVLHQCVA